MAMIKFLPNFTRRQWATVVVIAFADFCSALCVSIQAPFYPEEAERKGATASEYGFVFGCYELTVFISSPLFGKYLAKLVPKYVLNSGLFATGFCSILFGVLDKINHKNSFIALSFAVRIVEALGNAGFLTAAFAIVAAEFPDSVATTFACLETFFGLGLIVGPTLGGFLFQIGGFMLPFTVLGVLLISSALLTYLLLPTIEQNEMPHSDTGGLFRLLRIPSVILATFSVFAAAVAIGFLSATLEPHLRQFSLGPVVMGLMFVIEGGIYAVTAPIWGYLCDRWVQPRLIMLWGAVCIVIGFSLIGPAPYIPLTTTFNLAVAGLVVMGFGVGAELVSGFVSGLQEATFYGFPNNLHTYGLVSGLWTSTFALGSFVGPSVAGILYDQIGFSYSTLFVIFTHFLLGCCILFFFSFRAISRGILTQNASDYQTLPGADHAARDRGGDNTKILVKQDRLDAEWTSAE